MAHYLEFEKPIAELEGKIEELRHLSDKGDVNIAEPDARGQLIGSPMIGRGIIEYEVSSLGLNAGLTGARFTTTTEVYPDSPRTTPEQCIEAQVTGSSSR